MAFTTSLSLSTLLTASPVPHSYLSLKTPTHFLFPKLPLKTQRNPLPVLSCTSQQLPQSAAESNENTLVPRVTDYDYDYDHDLAEAVADEDEEIGSGICAVPKKRTSRTKTRIRKNVWKRKAYFAALKAYSLAKSIATGNSKSFLLLDKKK